MVQVRADEVTATTWSLIIALVSYEGINRGLMGLYHVFFSDYTPAMNSQNTC